MPRVAPHLPAESDLLCESCGYTLNGLPESGNCPECGQAVAASTVANPRQPTAWEHSAGTAGFLATTRSVIFAPTRFYRSIYTRGSLASADRFGRIHILLASILFGITGAVHVNTFTPDLHSKLWFVFLPVGTAVVLMGLTRIAARLSAWEAAYRGLRLPLDVVLRGLHYHAAHYLPVALVGLVTVVGFQIGMYTRPLFMAEHEMAYLYVLSSEVVIGAGYLFNTYWIGMRNMMYANH